MDTSPSILSAQYNNTSTSPEELSRIRGSGMFSTSFPMSSNYSLHNNNQPTDYVRRLRKENNEFQLPLSQSPLINLSQSAPVGKRVNDRFEYPKTLTETLQGDPYLAFGLQANHSAPTALNSLLFHSTNVQYIQKRILDEVFNITGIRIKPQSENSILIIMNNKYQYSLVGNLPTATPHLALPRGEKPCSLRKRLEGINKAVIQECVKQILSGMNMYADYYKHASSLPVPLSRPTYVSSKGANVLSENIGLTSGNSEAIASFNMRDTIIN